MLLAMGMNVPGFGLGGAHLKCKDPECNRMCDCCDEEMTQETTSPGRTDHRLQVELPTLLRGGIVRAAPALGGQPHLPGDRPCHAGCLSELDSLRRDCRHHILSQSHLRLHSGSLHFKWAPPHPKPGTCMPMVTSTGGSLSQFWLEPMLPLSRISRVQAVDEQGS